VGSIEPGKWADLVLWKPAYFGVKAEFVLKGGFLAWSQMGDANASIPTPQPVYGRPMFGAFGGALSKTCLSFVSKASIKEGIVERYDLKRQVVPVENCRSIGKKDMKNNDAMPKIEVNPDTYQVTVDGEVATCEPASVLPLAQRYFLF
jgi:urease subunit alpha